MNPLAVIFGLAFAWQWARVFAYLRRWGRWPSRLVGNAVMAVGFLVVLAAALRWWPGWVVIMPLVIFFVIHPVLKPLLSLDRIVANRRARGVDQ